jgi:hypothetical protein
MSTEANSPIDPAEAALRLARELDSRGIDYAIGGAIALAFCGRPRGTVDVDLTLFLPQEKASEAVRLLQQVGCDFIAARALASFREHGFCRVNLDRRRIDVFLEHNPFYAQAKARRRRVDFEGQQVAILDAESLAVFKLMFFRPQDIVDLRNILEMQRSAFDRDWVRRQLLDLVGPHDPRVIQWDELVDEIKP